MLCGDLTWKPAYRKPAIDDSVQTINFATKIFRFERIISLIFFTEICFRISFVSRWPGRPILIDRRFSPVVLFPWLTEVISFVWRKLLPVVARIMNLVSVLCCRMGNHAFPKPIAVLVLCRLGNHAFRKPITIFVSLEEPIKELGQILS